MIHYHGGPITPELVAFKAWSARHAFVSFANPQQISVAANITQSFALDNGAFSFWTSKTPVDWRGYYAWCDEWLTHPNCDWAVIPDVIDGDEAANDDLIGQWPFGDRGVPVWHMHESVERLERLAFDWPRVALGSSGDYSVVGNAAWWGRMEAAMKAVCRPCGRPITKLHGLRMLNPKVFTRMPLSSADSTNVARNSKYDSAWRGTYAPHKPETRAAVIAERIEASNNAAAWPMNGTVAP